VLGNFFPGLKNKVFGDGGNLFLFLLCGFFSLLQLSLIVTLLSCRRRFLKYKERERLFFHFLGYKDTKRAFTEIFIYKINWKVTIVGFFQTEKERFQANILCFAEIFEFWLVAFKILSTLYCFNNFFNFFLSTFSRLAGCLGLTTFWLLRFLHVVYPTKSLQITHAHIKRTACITAHW